MAQAAVTIVQGFDETPLTDDKAEELFDWMGDLAGDSLANDTSLKEVRSLLKTKRNMDGTFANSVIIRVSQNSKCTNCF